MKRELKYLFYATLLDSYQNYLSSSEIYQDYWGFSENPEKSEEEFEQEQFQSLINRINRIPLAWEDSEKADRGTAFNEVIDCMILRQKSHKVAIEKVYEESTLKHVVGVNASYNDRTFYFPIELCREFADYFKRAAPQVLTEAVLPTLYGDVLLYGYIDELMPDSVHDIKTTGKYKAGKFKNNWQHKVYPYCLRRSGNQITDFEYNVAVINETKYGINYSTFTEHYNYNPQRDITLLINHVEGLIEFIEANRHLITDKKIFNKHDNN